LTPQARLRAAIDVLETIEAGRDTADRVLSAWGRAHRFAGAKDRAAIADHVYACLRRRRSLAWPLRSDSARAAVIGLAASGGSDPAALFTGQGHAPAALTADERAALAEPPPPPPDPVRLDYPDWLDAPLRQSLGPRFEASMAALQDRAPLDLRVNTLKADPAAAAAALAAEGVATAPGPLSPTCLRAAPGAPVARSRAYADGLVELQDAASQAVADFAAARPGETVLDFCAGGGGKTLALAAAMGGRGRLVAHDADPRRMRDLPARLERAGARAETPGAGGMAALRGACDLVLVDAPCSGSGSWRRDPLGKWRLTPERLEDIAQAQREALSAAAAHVRPGGRLVYATCSLLICENDARFQAWLGAAPARALRLTPDMGGDGFYAAAARRAEGDVFVVG
jgi:16S rRNA (cytosine967-C5)-methyltransferase